MDVLGKIKSILSSPDKFFSNLKEKTIQDALLYYIILFGFNVVMSYIVFLVFGDAITKTLFSMLNLNSPIPQFSSMMIFGQMILGYIFGVLLSFVMAAILYVWLRIFRGNKGYVKVYQLFVYSNTPSLLLKWIPFLSFFTWIYDLILLIIGTKKIYNFSTTKAVLIYLIPLAIIFIVSIIILAAVFTFFGNFSALNTIPGY